MVICRLTMSSELHFPEPEEANALVQDIVDFIDSCEDQQALSSPGNPSSPGSDQSSLTVSGDRAKRRRAKEYSPGYERRRREKKKAAREALKTQVQQYEAQLELLRLRQPVRQVSDADAKWGWVEAATAEEGKRRKAEEPNRQLRGLLVQHLSTAQTFKNLLTQDSDLAERAQLVLSNSPPSAPPAPLATFSTLEAIASHLKGGIGQLYAASDFVFDSASMFKEDTDSLGSLATAASLKYQDPLGEPCFELLSSTPLACNFTMAVHLLWTMMVGKEVFGPDAACYTMKTQQLTQSSAEMEYSFDLNAPDAPGTLDGVTLLHKYEEVNRTVLVWTSMMVLEGTPYFRSQRWASVTRQPCNPEGETVVRMCSRVSGEYFGVPCNGTNVDSPVARTHQPLAKSRLDRVQMKILKRAEGQCCAE